MPDTFATRTAIPMGRGRRKKLENRSPIGEMKSSRRCRNDENTPKGRQHPEEDHDDQAYPFLHLLPSGVPPEPDALFFLLRDSSPHPTKHTPTFNAGSPTSACIIPQIFCISNQAAPTPHDDDDKLEGAPPDWCEVDPAEEEESHGFALELAFEDARMRRREGDEDQASKG
jgi:hypothetical protein